ncbi:hypothetical protein H6784_04000 [Candidatus Nomurabacteria bacterium]|nr:hypothetical protein [Candidatus Nomurabacteria bacterium]
MELSERYIQKLENEGFASVYEGQDAAGKVYSERISKGKLSILVTDGSLTFTMSGREKVVAAGQRFDIPPSTTYSQVAGPLGAIYIVGEMD